MIMLRCRSEERTRSSSARLRIPQPLKRPLRRHWAFSGVPANHYQHPAPLLHIPRLGAYAHVYQFGSTRVASQGLMLQYRVERERVTVQSTRHIQCLIRGGETCPGVEVGGV
jgi:hypothetical protein